MPAAFLSRTAASAASRLIRAFCRSSLTSQAAPSSTTPASPAHRPLSASASPPSSPGPRPGPVVAAAAPPAAPAPAAADTMVAAHKPKLRSDYRPLGYAVDKVRGQSGGKKRGGQGGARRKRRAALCVFLWRETRARARAARPPPCGRSPMLRQAWRTGGHAWPGGQARRWPGVARRAARARTTIAPRARALLLPATAPSHFFFFPAHPSPPPPQVHLTFALGDETTRVTSLLSITPSPASPPTELLLDGRPDVALVSVRIDGAPAAHDLVGADRDKLAVTGLPATPFTLEVVTDLLPRANTSLAGLYVSGGRWCTQCEAEGFRGITFFPDRPDVMAPYTTRIEADATVAPVLLGNGNLVEAGPLPGSPGRHYAVWEDPFPKPCYLFALVAGDLTRTAGTFTTASGRSVDLHFYTAAKDAHKVGFALESLQKAMAWDEATYGLEYDLDLFNVVAVDDFVMGAMENKSLNIFNSRLVLASPTTASDGDYARIEGVIGHEYFHNWTGNRVTCRDWFQLTLKEGLTVYRDQEFSADMGSRPVKRIEDVCRLRAAQFPEDAGAMAHPIRPESYIKMDNFYTCTVYEKGAEVVRLYATLLGVDGFRKGMDLYFARHDGAAVTCDDFRAAMADANGADLASFAAWYAQAGTPALTIETAYDEAAKTFTISASQATPPTPGQAKKGPVPIPIRVGLLGPDGAELELQLQVKRERGERGERGRGTPTPTHARTPFVLTSPLPFPFSPSPFP